MSALTVAAQLSLRWSWLAWLGMIFTTLAIGAIGGVVRGDPAPVVLRWGISDFGTFAIAVYVVGVSLAVGCLVRLLGGVTPAGRALGLHGPLTGSGAGAAVIAFGAASVLYPLVEVACSRMGVGMYWHPRVAHMVIENALDVALIVTFAVLLGPLCEELLFRGYLLRALQARGFGFWRAAFVSGLAFTSTHVFLGPGVMLFILLWSFLPSLLYRRFGNLYPAVLFHAANNAFAYLVVPVVFS